MLDRLAVMLSRLRGRNTVFYALLCACPVMAAPPAHLSRAQITSWGLADGLPEESVAGLAESPDGYLWLATREGLVRFDGRSFRTFSPGEGAGLYDHGLGAVAATRNTLWTGGRDYIGYARADRFQSFTKPHFVATPFPRHRKDRYGVASIRLRPDGSLLLWRSDGVYQVPAVQAGRPSFPQLLLAPPPGETMLGFHEGRSGRQWIVTQSGLKMWNRGQWKTLRALPNRPSGLLEARDGSLWIRSQTSLHHLTPTGVRQYTLELTPTDAPLTALMEDRDGAIWIGSIGQAIRITGGQLEYLNLAGHVQPDDLIQALHQSRDGAIWMGSRTGILVRTEAPVFNTVGYRDGVQGSSIAAVQQDRQGRLWIGTRTSGVFVKDGGPWRKLPGTEGVVTQALLALSNGRVIGADSKGLWLSHLQGVRRIQHNADTILGSFRAFSSDYGDHLYFSDFSGVYRLPLPHANVPVKMSDLPSVRSLIEAHDGLWALSWERGLAHIAHGRTTEYHWDTSRARRGMTLMALTPKLFLIGTNTGVFAFDRGTRQFTSPKAFLPDEQIFFIQPDDHGNLWFAGRRGLFSASRAAITAYFEGRGSDIVPTRLTAKQGLISTNFGLGTSAVATLTREGELWLASQGGAIHFRPSAVISATTDIRCAVEEITADGTPVSLVSPVQVGPGTTRIQIQYTVLGRKAAENPVFRYRIEGDSPWTETSTFQAVYTNLKPGNYQFQLQARVAALRWPDTVTTLDFTVAPLWYERGYVQMGSAVSFTLAVITVWRLRVRRMRQQNSALESRVRLRTAELAQARDQAEQSRVRAEAAARVKSEFLANMSHEIRTPLNGVIGMTELALQTDLSETQRELLGVAKLSADSLLTVINDVLDFSKIESGKVTLDPVPFRLRQTAEDTLKIVSISARQKGVGLSVNVASDVPDYLLGDSGRLRQILLNLLANAVKFTHEGAVALSVEVETAVGSEAVLHFAVKDTGIGIPADKHKTIFLAFEQADSSITRRHGGTGLGLAITSRLVQLMGGRIWLNSDVNRGTTFHFTVRLGLGQPPGLAGLVQPSKDSAPTERARPGRPARILLAEDNRVNQLVAVRLLQAQGYEVTVAQNGLEALAAWEENVFDLLLFDVHMPDMDGIEATVEIRRRESGKRRVPIIALTASAFAEDRLQCLAAGMDDYLTKPIVAADLLTVLDRWWQPSSPVRAKLASKAQVS